jgi:hypothetical protein
MGVNSNKNQEEEKAVELSSFEFESQQAWLKEKRKRNRPNYEKIMKRKSKESIYKIVNVKMKRDRGFVTGSSKITIDELNRFYSQGYELIGCLGDYRGGYIYYFKRIKK